MAPVIFVVFFALLSLNCKFRYNVFYMVIFCVIRPVFITMVFIVVLEKLWDCPITGITHIMSHLAACSGCMCPTLHAGCGLTIWTLCFSHVNPALYSIQVLGEISSVTRLMLPGWLSLGSV